MPGSDDPPTDPVLDAIADELAEVYLLVGPLYRRVLRVVELAEDANRVSVGVRAVLDQLRRHGRMTVPQIARSQSLSRQFVQRMVNEAQAGGFVELIDNPHHRRSRSVTLTAEGTRAITAVADRERAQLRPVAAGVTSGEIDATKRVLRRMLDGLAAID